MMRFRLLGPLEVLVGDDWRAIGAPKWRSVLAALLIHPGQIVSADTLISEVWGDEPPARAANLVSIYVLRLRRLIGDADNRVLVTRAPGYQLRVTAEDTDALLFEALVRDGRRAYGAGDPQAAARLLTEALGLWHGRPLADVPPTPLVEAEAERLSELRLGAVELRITAELALGGHDQAVAELRRLLADHPLREGLWLLLMRALDGAGRHAEALEVYGQAREAISAQLGVDPGAELRQLHAELLAKDSAAPAGVIIGGQRAGRDGRGAARDAGDRTRRAAAAAARARGAAHRRSCRPTSSTSPGGTSRWSGWASCCRTRARRRAATRARSASRWWRAPAGSARPRWPCTPPTGCGAASPTGSCTSTCSARPRTRCRPATCWPGSCATSAWTAGTSRWTRPSGRPGTGPRWPAAGCWSCWTTRGTPPRSGRCCRAPRRRAVLVTTRSRMPDLASTRLVDLNVLDDDDALKLFVKVVGEARAAAEPEATAELLEACAGPAAGHQDLRGPAGHPQRLDHRGHGRPAPRRAPAAGRAAGRGPRRPGQLPGQLRQPAGQHRHARGIDPARAFCLLGLWTGTHRSRPPRRRPCSASPSTRPPTRWRSWSTRTCWNRSAPDRYRFHDLLRVYAAERAADSRARGRARRPRSRRLLELVHAHRRRGRHRRAAAPLQHPARRPADAAARRPPSPAPRRPSPGTTASAPTWSPPPARRPRPACTRSPGGCPPPCSRSSTAAATGRTASPRTASRWTAPARPATARARRGS